MSDDLFDVIGEDPVRVRLRVHVRPGSGRSAVVGRHGDALHIRVGAPPVGGRANEDCRKLLEELLGLKDVELTSGEKTADKRFAAQVGDLAELRRRLEQVLDEAGQSEGGGSRTARRRKR
jgi:uncharacterized protein